MDDLTHLSLFTGIGGLDLAAEWAGFRTVGQCEWADYPRAVLEKHWPGLPRWRDIRTLTGDDFFAKTGLRTVTVLSGGFPCQPFSTAGKRRGKDDDRYLWPEMLRVIQEIRPAWVVGENVAGIVSMALDTVLSDLESIGYACQAFVIPACAVDAPHRRDRTDILAYANCSRQQGREQHGAPCNREPRCTACECGEAVSDTDSQRLQIGRHEQGFQTVQQENRVKHVCCHVSYADNRRRDVRRNRELSAIEEIGTFWCNFRGGTPEYGTGEWWAAEPDVGRVAHGVPSRVGRLKCLGNAVVPQQFYPIFRAIVDLEVSQGKTRKRMDDVYDG